MVITSEFGTVSMWDWEICSYLRSKGIETLAPHSLAQTRIILAAHCGYFGVLPQSFSTEWKLVPKVLAIVDENASAIDARMPKGPVTLAKLAPGFESLNFVEGMLEGYVQYEDSDCRDGAVLRVPDGRRLLEQLYSHLYLLLSGRYLAGAELMGRVLGLAIVSQ